MVRTHSRAQIAVVLGSPRQETGQLGQCHLIHVTLEFDHDLERNPVFVPSPCIEFGMIGRAQIHVAVTTCQLQQEPDLLLSAIVSAGVPSDEVRRDLVPQPVARACDDPHVIGVKTDLFVQLTVHRLLRRLAVIDAPLRELPGVGPDSLAPEHLVSVVEQDDADVGSEPFTVEHNQPQFFR